jgi:para-nitrobenzyl esterase
MNWLVGLAALLSIVVGTTAGPLLPTAEANSRSFSASGESRTSSSASSPANPCIVRVTEGRAAGRFQGRSCSYRGLRYAAAPSGALRFRPPVAPPRWDGLRQLPAAANYVCPRVEANITESYVGHAPSASEDCLRVTVSTPARPAKNRPVIVYLHGGAFLSGSGFQGDFNGRRMALRGNAVVVTVNYRLGLFGYLELGDLSADYRGSGNNGLRDQIAALRWVRRNAGAFGGDPANITVMGESAGAISISAMLAGKAPEKLFRRAILQSGNGYLIHTRKQAHDNARELLTSGRVTTVGQLRKMTVAELLQIQSGVLEKHPIQRSTLFAPFVDGRLIPGSVIPRLVRGSARHVDLMIGTNHDEAMFFTLGSPTLAFLPALANPFFPASLRAQQLKIIATYGQNLPAGGLLPGREGTTISMISDQLFRVPAIRMAQAQRRWNNRTFMYRFDWAPNAPATAPPQEDVGAMHTLELPFVFGTLRLGWVPHAANPTDAERRARQRLSTQMLAAWTTFAQSGSPSRRTDPSVPTWKPYDAKNRFTMLWDRSPALVGAPADAERASWDLYPFAHLVYELPIG